MKKLENMNFSSSVCFELSEKDLVIWRSKIEYVESLIMHKGELEAAIGKPLVLELRKGLVEAAKNNMEEIYSICVISEHCSQVCGYFNKNNEFLLIMIFPK